MIGINRASFYRKKQAESSLNIELKKILQLQFVEAPSLGRINHTENLKKKGYHVNVKRVRRLLRELNIRGMCRKRFTTISRKDHLKYPYLLKDLTIERSNQVWAADITYIPTGEGHLYLMAIIDWYSRYIVKWVLSKTMHSDFCTNALYEALESGKPEIFNTDQGVQFTCHEFTQILKTNEVKISMDGKGCYRDNIIIERLWRSVKHEEVYIKKYETHLEAYENLSWYLDYYNNKRLHMSLKYRTPAEVYFAKAI